MKTKFHVEVTDPMAQEAVQKGGSLLKDLCLKEAQDYSEWLKAHEPEYAEGLARWEKQAIATYLFKKARKLPDR